MNLRVHFTGVFSKASRILIWLVVTTTERGSPSHDPNLSLNLTLNLALALALSLTLTTVPPPAFGSLPGCSIGGSRNTFSSSVLPFVSRALECTIAFVLVKSSDIRMEMY